MSRQLYVPKTGDLVLCVYRLPSPVQFWLHSVHVGTVLEPGDDPAAWNGTNSERSYCKLAECLPVRWMATENGRDHVQHDKIDSLFPVPEGRSVPWALLTEEEAQDLYRRGLALAGRHRDERGRAVLDVAVELRKWDLEPEEEAIAELFSFPCRVRDEAHRQALRDLLEVVDKGELSDRTRDIIRGIADHWPVEAPTADEPALAIAPPEVS